ncbi:MAG TPA: hypothetical protein VKB93_28145 [Thermoanaerobaculia bacterium]|nr:hypothetical protein [Thermoanaerobaculia bacterium]
MKASVPAFVFFAFALRAAAQEDVPPRQIDATQETLRKFVASIPEPPPKPPRKVTFHFGSIEFRALGMRWRINYLPIATPLPGSGFTTTHQWPDAFALTNTPIAMTPRSWHTQRQVNAEMRRIEKTERAKMTVKREE